MDGLREHLQKAEIEYIASHGGGYPETFKWDADILTHARSIGFKIRPGVETVGIVNWIRTTNGISISITDGFVVKA